ncbi:hypothetical protein BDZ89DRAFT_1048566 [Hymenopellis radicata]|nr:hypothetical protein BDZ89DRAFT_1048566 [Hymenopellis radicata]
MSPGVALNGLDRHDERLSKQDSYGDREKESWDYEKRSVHGTYRLWSSDVRLMGILCSHFCGIIKSPGGHNLARLKSYTPPVRLSDYLLLKAYRLSTAALVVYPKCRIGGEPTLGPCIVSLPDVRCFHQQLLAEYKKVHFRYHRAARASAASDKQIQTTIILPLLKEAIIAEFLALLVDSKI